MVFGAHVKKVIKKIIDHDATLIHQMPKIRSVDIDDGDDFMICDALVKSGIIKICWVYHLLILDFESYLSYISKNSPIESMMYFISSNFSPGNIGSDKIVLETNSVFFKDELYTRYVWRRRYGILGTHSF